MTKLGTGQLTSKLLHTYVLNSLHIKYLLLFALIIISLSISHVLILELLITLCSGEKNIHPDPHGFGRWSHKIIFSVMCLHTKCDPLRDWFCRLMININLCDWMEINASFYFRLKNLSLDVYFIRRKLQQKVISCEIEYFACWETLEWTCRKYLD